MKQIFLKLTGLSILMLGVIASAPVKPLLKMKVMSFNIRTSHGNDGVNSWENRKNLMAITLLKESPDVIGFQEMTPVQLSFLAGKLVQYKNYAVGRKDGKLEDEIMAIFYKDTYEVISDSTIWLSETPDVVGSKSWDAALYRTVSWVILRHKKSEATLMVVNTHFDHIGKIAREKSAELIINLIAQNNPGHPVIVTGDFNTTAAERPYKIITTPWANTFQLKDARYLSEASHKGGETTFNGYKDDEGKIIDFIFVSDGIRVKSHSYLCIKKKGVFISDHYPVQVVVELTKSAIAISTEGEPLNK